MRLEGVLLNTMKGNPNYPNRFKNSRDDSASQEVLSEMRTRTDRAE